MKRLHSWILSPREAVQTQLQLKPRIRIQPLPHPVRYVAGTDVCFSKKTNALWGGLVVLSYPEMERIEEQWAKGESRFPYIPGLLSFREIPILLQALSQMQMKPDVILCDGQGIAHPRGLGLAAHLGLILDIPSIGCAKTRLVGDFGDVGNQKGCHGPLQYQGETVGAVLRTKAGTKPVFVSPGFKVTHHESIIITLNCCTKYRIPEPIRAAHLLVNKRRRAEGG